MTVGECVSSYRAMRREEICLVMNGKSILVVEDDETLCEALRFNLSEAGYDVGVAYSAEEALAMPIENYSLVLLDIMMGQMSGTALAKVMKSKASTAQIPIIFCTAKDAEDDMVAGLRLGADDYITKPYSIANVLARVEAVLRRTSQVQPAASAEIQSYKGLEIDHRQKCCFVNGEAVRLPRKEFEILALLLSRRGEVFSREDLLKRIWPDQVVVLNRVVDVNIARLRSKLGEYGKNIVSRSGYGYGFFEKD